MSAEVIFTSDADLRRNVHTASSSAELRRNGWTQGVPVARGQVVYVESRARLRRGVAVKVGRKNVTVEYTTVSSVDEAARFAGRTSIPQRANVTTVVKPISEAWTHPDTKLVEL